MLIIKINKKNVSLKVKQNLNLIKKETKNSKKY